MSLKRVKLQVLKQNVDRPHRCPSCNAVADVNHLSNRAVVICCNCSAHFTKYPFFASLLPRPKTAPASVKQSPSDVLSALLQQTEMDRPTSIWDLAKRMAENGWRQESSPADDLEQATKQAAIDIIVFSETYYAQVHKHTGPNDVWDYISRRLVEEEGWTDTKTATTVRKNHDLEK